MILYDNVEITDDGLFAHEPIARRGASHGRTATTTLCYPTFPRRIIVVVVGRYMFGAHVYLVKAGSGRDYGVFCVYGVVPADSVVRIKHR